ncbi:MAG: hypothetical protein AB1Z98_21785 [Nannocystaceae bacterium]
MTRARSNVVMMGLCASMATSTLGCDQPASGRSDGLTSLPTADPCDGLAERVAECAEDEGCAIEDLEAEFAMCTAGGKADGPLDALEDKIDELKQSLVDRAAGCYEDEDASCLWWTYWSLAAGAKVLRMPTASSNMFNFLYCDEDPLQLRADDIRADPAVARTEEAFIDQVWCQGLALAQTEPELTTTVTIPGTVIAADDTDIWYGLGHFTISADAEVEIAQGRVVRVIMTTTVFDIYDWHAGLAAGGDDEAVAGFQDAWAAWLVDQGEACEFEMGTEWSETFWDHEPVGCEAAPPSEEPRD